MYAGAPWHAQARLKQIVDSQYKPAPDGLVGNDDLGQMSAWLVFTSLGFYPVAPASNQYVLGRPFVPRATVHLPNHHTFTVVADGLSETNAFVQAVTLNGRPLDRTFITHEEILAGGELRFVMSPKEQASWSQKQHTAPYSLSPASAH
jgi:putative alpha-1,2-mannosidase